MHRERIRDVGWPTRHLNELLLITFFHEVHLSLTRGLDVLTSAKLISVPVITFLKRLPDFEFGSGTGGAQTSPDITSVHCSTVELSLSEV